MAILCGSGMETALSRVGRSGSGGGIALSKLSLSGLGGMPLSRLSRSDLSEERALSRRSRSGQVGR